MLVMLFNYSLFGESTMNKTALTQIYKAICLAEEEAQVERKKLALEHEKKYPQTPGFPKLEINPKLGPKTPLEILDSIIELSISKMQFLNREAEKKFYKDLEKDRKELMKAFWKHARLGPLTKNEIKKFAKSYTESSNDEIPTTCQLSSSQKNRLLLEIF